MSKCSLPPKCAPPLSVSFQNACARLHISHKDRRAAEAPLTTSVLRLLNGLIWVTGTRRLLGVLQMFGCGGGSETTKKGMILRMLLWSQTRLRSDGLNSPKTNAKHSPKQEIPPQEGHLHSLRSITFLLRGVALWIGWGGIWVQTRPLRPAAIPELSPNKSLLISDGFGYCPMV